MRQNALDAEIRLGLVSIEWPTESWDRGYEHGVRATARRVAEDILGRHLVLRPTHVEGRVCLVAVEETPRERAIIAEGLAMVEAAAREHPELLDRYAHLSKPTPAGAAA